MSKKKETVADIVAEMRKYASDYYQRSVEWGGDKGNPGMFYLQMAQAAKVFADRIEAAHRRDIEAYDLIDFMSPVGRVKPAPVGNGAKMREVLEQIRQKAIATIPGSSIQKRMLDKFRLLASAALAEPPRNCDRFNTLEDALAGWREVSPAESGPFDEWLFAEAKGETDAIK